MSRQILKIWGYKLTWLVLAMVAVFVFTLPALSAHWTEAPIPVDAVDFVEQDSKGNLWAVGCDDDVYLLKNGSTAWQKASEGLDKGIVTGFQIEADKLFINISGFGVYARGIDDDQWHMVDSYQDGQYVSTEYFVSFDGYLWAVSGKKVFRLDPAQETWEEVSGGLLVDFFYPSNLAASADYLYLGVSEDKSADLKFPRVDVYRIGKGTSQWGKTGLNVTPLPEDLKAFEGSGTAFWGARDLVAIDGYLITALWSPQGPLSSQGRFYFYTESTAAWQPVPPIARSKNVIGMYLFPTEPFQRGQHTPVQENRFFFRYSNNSAYTNITYVVFNPQTGAWENDLTLPTVSWSKGSYNETFYIGEEIVIGPALCKHTSYPSTPPSGFVKSVPLPTEISTDPAVIGTNFFFAVIFAVIFGFTSTLFNSTIKENHDALVRLFQPLKRPRLSDLFNKAKHATSEKKYNSAIRLAAKVVSHRLFRPLAIVVITALVYSFLDPGFGFSIDGAVLYLSLMISISAITLAHDGVQSYVARRRYGGEAHLSFFPEAVAIAMACVIVSRAIGFQPGYLYGFIGGIVFAGAVSQNTKRMGKLVLVSMLALLAFNIATWFLAVPVTTALQGSDAAWLKLLQGACIGIFVSGLETILFALVPLGFLEGEKIFRWNKIVWLATFTLVVFLFWHILINRDSQYASSLGQKNVVTLIVLSFVYSAISIGTFLFFRWRKKAAAHKLSSRPPRAPL